MPIPRVEHFSGDGSTKAFTLKGPVEKNTEVVFIEGPIMNPAGYVKSGNPTTITFSLAPQAGTNNIAVMYSEADS